MLELERLIDLVVKLLRRNTVVLAGISGRAWKYARQLSPQTQRLIGLSALATVVISVSVLSLISYQNSYHLDQKVAKLLGETSVKKADIKATKTTFTYNQEEATKAQPVKKTVAAADSPDSTGQTTYAASLAKDLQEGIKFSDGRNELSFKLIPQFDTQTGRQAGSRVTYPEGGRQHIYTFKRNGIKEDIILPRAPAQDSLTYSWKLELDTKLEAKLLANGSVGIYSANPYLYGGFTIADKKSQDLIDNARAKGEKTYLAFVLPAPFIVGQDGRKTSTDVSYQLKDNLLTLTARNLHRQSYPLSIDPTIVVTTTGDFRTGGSDTGMIDYATSGQIKRDTITNGSLFSYTTDPDHFTTPRYGHSSLAYNGYLYIMGGLQQATSTACKNTGVASQYCNDVQYAAIASDGSIGAFTTNTNYFSLPREWASAVAYNGRLYITGGYVGSSISGCKDAGTNLFCNDIQYATINPDGSVGSFTTNTNYFAFARVYSTTLVYNGYMYVVGGMHATFDTSCRNSGSGSTCNDVQVAPINADGTVGTFSNTSYFISPRKSNGAVIYNGYLYVAGGLLESASTDCKNSGSSDVCNDIQYAPVNADGTVGAFATTNYFSTPRYSVAVGAYGGFLYIAGGVQNDINFLCTDEPSSTAFCNNVQYTPINADGSVGSISETTYFSYARSDHSMLIYNDKFYIIGGWHDYSDTNCKLSGSSEYCSDVQYASINTSPTSSGTLGSFTTNSNYFSTPRDYSATVAYNGYLYITGGEQVNNDASCVNASTSDHCNDVQYAPINTDGSIGAFVTSPNHFSIPRESHTAVAYNNFLYIVGGQQEVSASTCKNSGTTTKCNDVQYAPINADGSIGAFTLNSQYFATPRYGHTSAAYNGYLYVIGGYQDATNTACTNGAAIYVCNDVQYAPINANGSIGTFVTDPDHFTTERFYHASVAYNGYLYVAGGWQIPSSTACKASGTSDRCSDVQYAVINSDGSINSFTTNTNYFAFPRFGHAISAYNNHLYIGGGNQASSNTSCKNTGVSATFCNDTQYALINSNGSVAAFSNTGYFAYPRVGSRWTAYNGYLYAVGGYQWDNDTTCKNTDSSNLCSDVQYAGFKYPAQKATYERTFDIGLSSPNVSVDSLVLNGTSVCGERLSYSTAPASGIFGGPTMIPAVFPATTYAIAQSNIRYVRVNITLENQACGTQSSITDITLNWTYPPPDAPALNSPGNGSPAVSNLPTFQLRSPQLNNDYLRYKIEVCSTSNCSNIVRTIDQTSSQTGWTGQDQQGSTAYTGNSVVTSSTMASHTYQATALNWNTQYWWRAYAIDPAWSNTWSAASGIYSFTTNSTPTAPTLSLPVNASTGASLTPEFRLASTDPDGDYVRYRIEVCTTSNCSSVLRTIDQPTSQTGWKSQSTQSGTAYTSGQTAVHNYQTPALSPTTQYWWRAYAIDSAGVNVLGTASAIATFTTGTASTPGVDIWGGTDITGGSNFNQ